MWRLGIACLAFAGVTLAGTVAAVTVMAVTHTLFENPWVGSICGVAGASIFIAWLVSNVLEKRKDAEFAAGYTTSRLGYPNLEQVDESTGLIVRAAGEPLLTRQEHRDRVLAYKARVQDS